MNKLQEEVLDYYCKTFVRKGAALFLWDNDKQVFEQKSSYGLILSQISFKPDDELISCFRDNPGWVVNVDDLDESQFSHILPKFKAFQVKLCVPFQYESKLEGFLVLGKSLNSNEVLIFEDYDLMKIFARQATSLLLCLKLSAQLSLAKEMAALGQVSSFVIHDLKNHVSNLSLILENAHKFIDKPEFQQDMLETLDETIVKITALIQRLRNIKDKKELNLSRCDLTEVVRNSVKAAGSSPDVVVGDSVPAVIDVEEIEKVVSNLVLNAKESGAQNGSIKVNVGIDDNIFFIVSDQGCGMSDEFIRNRLFKPFQTTKQNGFGIGLFQCRQIVEAHGGKIHVISKEGEGTTVMVNLPATAH
jgi:putative PEP-CTERM system histidine kinase